MFIQFYFLDSLFPQASTLKGFPFLDPCKQDACQCFPSAIHTSASVFEAWVQWIFEGWLPLPGWCRSPSTCVAAAQELLSFSIRILSGRMVGLGASLPGWYPCLADQVLTNWSSPKVATMWKNWTPRHLGGQVVLDSSKMPFSFGWNSIFLVTAFDRFSAGDLAGCFLSC